MNIVFAMAFFVLKCIGGADAPLARPYLIVRALKKSEEGGPESAKGLFEFALAAAEIAV